MELFKVNDTVLYGSHGVCLIADISPKEFCGKTKEYYTLRPVYENKSVIFVPADNAALKAKMRRILSTSEIYSIIRSMPDEENIWIENDTERKEKYSEILKNGNRRALMQMIKTIYIHRESLKAKGRKLRSSDERLFNDAEKMLYEEFAHVLNISRDEVLPFILEQIKVDEKN